MINRNWSERERERNIILWFVFFESIICVFEIMFRIGKSQYIYIYMCVWVLYYNWKNKRERERNGDVLHVDIHVYVDWFVHANIDWLYMCMKWVVMELYHHHNGCNLWLWLWIRTERERESICVKGVANFNSFFFWRKYIYIKITKTFVCVCVWRKKIWSNYCNCNILYKRFIYIIIINN